MISTHTSQARVPVSNNVRWFWLYPSKGFTVRSQLSTGLDSCDKPSILDCAPTVKPLFKRCQIAAIWSVQNEIYFV